MKFLMNFLIFIGHPHIPYLTSEVAIKNASPEKFEWFRRLPSILDTIELSIKPKKLEQA